MPARSQDQQGEEKMKDDYLPTLSRHEILVIM